LIKREISIAKIANLLDDFEEIELIDALWEAVKYKLNQKSP